MRRFVASAALLLVTGCGALPDVYLVDRHTVMEAEASGEWPQIEQRLLDEVRAGPEVLAAGGESRQRRAFQVLNGEFPTTAGQP